MELLSKNLKYCVIFLHLLRRQVYILNRLFFFSCGFMYFCFLPCKVSTAAATHPNSKDSPTFTNGMIPGEHNFLSKIKFFYTM